MSASRHADPRGQFTEAALSVLQERYAAKDLQGHPLETPEAVFSRVAREIAGAERTWGATDEAVAARAREFYAAMITGVFMPNSPTIMNAGRGNGLQYAACFVLPVEDSIEGIFAAQSHAAVIHRSGGGTGFAFSRLRPFGARVATTSGVCSGPVVFLKTYNGATEAVKQGSARLGANMAILRVDHPDVRRFIQCKRTGDIANFNISVGVTDAFMAALAAGRTYALLAQPGWPLPDGSSAVGGEAVGELKAADIWGEICEAAWATGDPGLFFIDRANAGAPNALPGRQTIEATNPCLAGSTLIETRDGPVKIRDLVGETPWVVTGTGTSFTLTRATAVFETRDQAPLLRLRTRAGWIVEATPDHRIRLAGGTYRRMDALSPGVHVATIEGDTEVTALEDAGAGPVFDLTAPPFHNVVANGIVVHNCGEQALPPWGVCNLGHINLARFVQGGVVDYDGLSQAVPLGVRFLDNVVECNPYPLPQIREQSLFERRIGLGVMGWADMLIALGIPYASEEAIQLAQTLGAFLKDVAVAASRRLAAERGAFPGFAESVYRHEVPRRNSNVTTIAPTGTTSFFADCNGGIEPMFAIAYEHRAKRDGGMRVLRIVNRNAQAALALRGLDRPDVLAAVGERGVVGDLASLPADVRALLATAREISVEWHVRHQAAWQRAFSESCVSKTINLPREAAVEDVRRAYQLAWDLGCMGITIFRDGCKGDQVLNTGTSVPAADDGDRLDAAPRARPAAAMIEPMPDEVIGRTFHLPTPLGEVSVTVNCNHDGDPTEVFVRAAKTGSDVEAFSEALGRLISTFVRFNWLPDRRRRLEEIVAQLEGIGAGEAVGFGPQRVSSVPDAVAKALDRFLRAGALQGPPALPPGPPAFTPAPAARKLGAICSACGLASIVVVEGCQKCLSCGLSKC